MYWNWDSVLPPIKSRIIYLAIVEKNAESIFQDGTVDEVIDLVTFDALWKTSLSMQDSVVEALENLKSISFRLECREDTRRTPRIILASKCINVCQGTLESINTFPALMRSPSINLLCNALASCRNLQCICLRHCVQVNSELLQKFASQCDDMPAVPRLRYLDLDGCTGITHGRFLDYKCMYFLHTLRVTWCRDFRPTVGWLRRKKHEKIRNPVEVDSPRTGAHGGQTDRHLSDSHLDDDDAIEDAIATNKEQTYDRGLVRLYAAGCAALDMGDFASHPEDIQSLEVLNLAFIPQVTDEVLQAIPKMPNILQVYLSRPSNNTWEWGSYTHAGINYLEERGVQVHLVVVP